MRHPGIPENSRRETMISGRRCDVPAPAVADACLTAVGRARPRHKHLKWWAATARRSEARNHPNERFPLLEGFRSVSGAISLRGVYMIVSGGLLVLSVVGWMAFEREYLRSRR